jgi:hypothetical protein
VTGRKGVTSANGAVKWRLVTEMFGLPHAGRTIEQHDVGIEPAQRAFECPFVAEFGSEDRLGFAHPDRNTREDADAEGRRFDQRVAQFDLALEASRPSRANRRGRRARW